MLSELYAADIKLPAPVDPGSVSGITSSGIFSILQTGLAVIGFLLIFYVVFVTVQAFAKGDIGKAFKRIIGGGLIIILCFNPGIIASLVNVASNLVTQIVETFDSTVDTGTKTGNTPPPPAPAPAPD